MEPARGDSCLSGQRRGLPYPERIIAHLRIGIPSKSLQFQHPGDEHGNYRGRYRPPRLANPNQDDWLVTADWPGLMELALGESCPSGQRRVGAAHEVDKVTSPESEINPYLYNS